MPIRAIHSHHADMNVLSLVLAAYAEMHNGPHVCYA